MVTVKERARPHVWEKNGKFDGEARKSNRGISENYIKFNINSTRASRDGVPGLFLVPSSRLSTTHVKTHKPAADL